jgi:hypothetical protein
LSVNDQAFGATAIIGVEYRKRSELSASGAKIAFVSALTSYSSKNAADKLKMDIAPNLPHTTTPAHLQMTLDWFSKWL